jgi:hypothetical protein
MQLKVKGFCGIVIKTVLDFRYSGGVFLLAGADKMRYNIRWTIVNQVYAV